MGHCQLEGTLPKLVTSGGSTQRFPHKGYPCGCLGQQVGGIEGALWLDRVSEQKWETRSCRCDPTRCRWAKGKQA